MGYATVHRWSVHVYTCGRSITVAYTYGWKQMQHQITGCKMHASEVLNMNLTWYSWWVPGRKPGTSTKVTMGMLKASQKRMNLCHSSSHT